ELIGKPLSEVFGEEIARKMLAGPDNRIIDGKDLKLGGEGMRGFYDKILPRIASNLTKKWGGKVGRTDIKLNEKGWLSGRAAMEILGEQVDWGDLTPQQRDDIMDRARKVPTIVHSLDITPEMRESILTHGFPLFAKARSQSFKTWFGK